MATCAHLAAQTPPQREVIEGVSTTGPIPGKPYDLAGNRIVFTNWYYVNPGDLDWRDSTGKSVYVHGDSDLFEARHVGINAPRGISIVAHKPEIIGPIDIPVHRCFFRDGEIYRGWSNNAYYESRDAMKWEKKGDLAFEGPNDDGVYHVFIDPSAPPAERFKAVWSSQITRAEFDQFRAKRPDGWEPRALLHTAENGMVSCLRGGVSGDGIHWKALPDPLVVEYADTLNTCYYDTTLRKYVLYTRYWSVGPASEKVKPDIRHSWTDIGRRAIGRSESPDFRAFPPSQQILEPTPEMLPSEQLYTNCHTTIPAAPDQHLMFPAIWNASIDDTTRIALASSHDGKTWHWVPGGDLMYTGPFGQWNGGCIWAIPELMELPNGDWALPYLGHNLPHKYPRGKLVGRMGYAVWPKGRLVSLHAPESGQFTMIPVIAKGNVLKVNALTRRTGWIRAEVVGGGSERSIDACDPIVGDQLWQPITWKGSKQTGVSPGTPITLRFELYQADLFGVEFGQE
ncbi:hypothetical protein [Fontivita pretiosa]|uniref:hypothetical protein n=1 Tax=Fontivita pretiosa TaxID=2989684 RepID=UPI003D184B16